MSNALKTNIFNRELKNPILTASGTFGYGVEFEEFYDINILGGIISKGLTLNKKDGNTGIRIFETPSGIMNSIGLQNPGVKHFLDNELGSMKKLNDFVVVNLGGNTESDYLEAAELLEESSVDAIELNISCPNVKSGGMAFGIVCEDAVSIVNKIRKRVTKPLIVKLSPNAYELVRMAEMLENEGVDALSLVNTFQAIAVDIYKRKAVFDNITAGLSGPAIKPIALRMVRDVYKKVKIPIIGIGGITNYKDVVEYIMCGATLVQIGTGNLINPIIGKKIIEDLEKFVVQEKINNLSEIRGII